MWDNTTLRRINLRRSSEVAHVRRFLERFGLSFDAAVDYTVALYREETIVATGSLAGEVLRNFAVDEAMQGEGLTATVISELMREAAARGVYHYFIYTRPQKAHLFASLGFAEIARAEPFAALLESGLGSIQQYCRDLQQQTSCLPLESRAAIVMNGNPFTLGHLALVRAAAARSNVILFVVSEDRSIIPFADRFRLIRQGVEELPNVVVIPGGKYLISAATFPGYFTRENETVTAQTRLDATLFAARIAPALGIKTRYAGEEPYCEVTDAYNKAMADIFPAYGLQLQVMARAEANGEAISASQVRAAIRRDDWPTVAELVPATTLAYLRSKQAQAVIEQIKTSDSRH